MKTLSKDKSFKATREKANRLADDLHKKRHEKWIKYLEEKKELLEKMRNMPNPESS